MKIRVFIILLIALLPASFPVLPVEGAEPDYPALYNSVHDFAGILSPEKEATLAGLINELEKKTSDAVAVVTVETTAPVSLEEYAVKLYQNVGRSPDGRYGLGQKGKDNGVLILVAIKDEQARIEVGYGLEGAVTDAQASGIIRNIMLPLFRRGDFEGGIEQATGAVIGLIAKESGVEIEGASAPPKKTFSGSSSTGGGWVFFFIVLIVVLTSFFRASRGSSGTSSRGGGFWAGGGSGGFSGGGGGFGGGMSGGGGASGGW